jgi:hypothetical protein
MQRRDFCIGKKPNGILEDSSHARVSMEFQVGYRDEMHFLEEQLGNPYRLRNTIQPDFNGVAR